MSNPSVSVIVPVLNGEDVLGDCLRALEAQTYAGAVEVVVINDGSTDHTSEVARSFAGVKLIEQENRGRAAARNRGVAESSGTIIAFTDADCVPRPDWLEKLLPRLGEHDRRGIVGGSITIPPVCNLWQRLDHQAWAHSIGPDTPAGPTLFGSTASMCLLRSVFEEVGGFDDRLRGSEDSDLAFRIHSAGYENFFEPAAVVEHHHPRTTMASFLRQRFNYGRWTIQTVLKHKPLPPYSRMFPNSRVLLALLWPVYAVLATGFTVLRNWQKAPSVILLSPLHLFGRIIEYLGTVAGCNEYQKRFSSVPNV